VKEDTRWALIGILLFPVMAGGWLLAFAALGIVYSAIFQALVHLLFGWI
jgi:hypothetical protein